MGEGGRRHLSGGRPGRRPKPEAAGRSLGVLQACARAGIAPSTKPRAGQRVVLPSARSYPPPAGRRSQRPCQAEAGEAASRTPPGSQTPARQRRGHEGRGFVVCHNSADPELPRQKFCAPHLSRLGPVSMPTLTPRYPPARLRHPSRGLAAGQAQALLSAPKGPVASAAPEPGTRPSWEGRSGLGTHSPSPATSHPAVGEGAASPFHREPGPVSALRLGRVPRPQYPPKAGEVLGPARTGASGSPPSQARTRPRRRLPLPLGRTAAGPGGRRR